MARFIINTSFGVRLTRFLTTITRTKILPISPMTNVVIKKHKIMYVAVSDVTGDWF